jgi:hypothetical protein
MPYKLDGVCSIPLKLFSWDVNSPLFFRVSSFLVRSKKWLGLQFSNEKVCWEKKMLILYSAESNLLSARWCSILYYLTCSVSWLCHTLFKNKKKIQHIILFSWAHLVNLRSWDSSTCLVQPSRWSYWAGSSRCSLTLLPEDRDIRCLQNIVFIFLYF